MTSQAADPAYAPVLKSVTVKANVERAFKVFTEGFDSWWPRSHHIGSAPMRRAIMECRKDGRCYSEQVDGAECDWGRILIWEPPVRFVMAWLINAEWKYESDLTKTSEVEVRFAPAGEGLTRIELEHRHFERMGSGGESMRKGVEAPMGWTDLLRLYIETVERS